MRPILAFFLCATLGAPGLAADYESKIIVDTSNSKLTPAPVVVPVERGVPRAIYDCTTQAVEEMLKVSGFGNEITELHVYGLGNISMTPKWQFEAMTKSHGLLTGTAEIEITEDSRLRLSDGSLESNNRICIVKKTGGSGRYFEIFSGSDLIYSRQTLP